MHCFGDQVLSFCHRGGLEPRVVCRGEQIVTLLAMVAAGQGVSVVPEMAALADAAKACVYRPLGKPAPTRTLLRRLAQAAVPAGVAARIRGCGEGVARSRDRRDEPAEELHTGCHVAQFVLALLAFHTVRNPSNSSTCSVAVKAIQSMSPAPSGTSCTPLLRLTERASRAWTCAR